MFPSTQSKPRLHPPQPSFESLPHDLACLGELGLHVNLSEIDARTLLLPGERMLRWQVQRIALQQLTAACVLDPACEGLTFWDFTDNYSWINGESEDDDLLQMGT